MVALLALGAGALAAAGLVQQAVGSALAARMVRNAAIGAPTWPPVTVLKPLHGWDSLLESALESWFVLDYPALQLVFGVADAGDPAN